jgi:hypothetical protein
MNQNDDSPPRRFGSGRAKAQAEIGFRPLFFQPKSKNLLPPQGNCEVRGLVHFSADERHHGLHTFPENMDLTPSRQDFAVLLLPPLVMSCQHCYLS